MLVVEDLAKRQAKRHGRARDAEYIQRLVDFQRFLGVVLSTSERRKREEIVEEICATWRVSIGLGTRHKGDLKNELAYQSTLLDVATKAMAVQDRQSAFEKRRATAVTLKGAKTVDWSPAEGHPLESHQEETREDQNECGSQAISDKDEAGMVTSFNSPCVGQAI